MNAFRKLAVLGITALGLATTTPAFARDGGSDRGGNDDVYEYAVGNVQGVARGIVSALSGASDEQFNAVMAEFPGNKMSRTELMDIVSRIDIKPLESATRKLASGKVVPLKLDYRKGKDIAHSSIIVLGRFLARHDVQLSEWNERAYFTETATSILHEATHIFGFGLTAESDSDRDEINESSRIARKLVQLVWDNAGNCGLSGAIAERTKGCGFSWGQFKLVSSKSTPLGEQGLEHSLPLTVRSYDESFHYRWAAFSAPSGMLFSNVVRTAETDIVDSLNGIAKLNTECAQYPLSGGSIQAWHLPEATELLALWRQAPTRKELGLWENYPGEKAMRITNHGPQCYATSALNTVFCDDGTIRRTDRNERGASKDMSYLNVVCVK